MILSLTCGGERISRLWNWGWGSFYSLGFVPRNGPALLCSGQIFQVWHFPRLKPGVNEKRLIFLGDGRVVAEFLSFLRDFGGAEKHRPTTG
jgi:hypothetical protein